LSSDPRTVRRRSFWRFSAAEVRAHAIILAVVSWAIAIVLFTFGTTYRDPFGQLKWNDFVHFYTLGNIARHGPISHLYDAQAQYQDQVALVPESAPERYLPVYPPQIALVFAPLSDLPYHLAAALWSLVSIGVYGIGVRSAWLPVRSALTNFRLVAICAAGFPPFWSLILNGQTTAVPILAFSCAAIALSRGRKILAGLAFGLLFIKPQFGLMLAAVVVACREWSILTGLALSACIQLALVFGVLGRTVLLDYLEVLRHIPTLQDALEPSVQQMHSLAVITQLLPGGVSTAAWLFAAAVVSWMTIRIWRSMAPMYVRTASLVLGSVLVNPHLNLYDGAVLAAPLVSLSGWMEMQPESLSETRHRWHLALYALFVLLLIPTARIISLQLSPFVLLVLLYFVYRIVANAGEPSTTR
jgi:alpha-1,2-mannosyltransferase